MKLGKLSRLASVSAFALGLALYSAHAFAVAYDFDDPSTPLPVKITANVEQNVNVTVVDMVLPNIGATSDSVDTASLVMAPDGTMTDDEGAGTGGAGPGGDVTTGEAHLISGAATGTPANISFTGLLDSNVYVYYTNLQDLSDGAGPKLHFVSVLDDNPTPGNCVSDGLAAPSACTSFAAGIGHTDPATGAIAWNIGATIATVATTAPYDSNAYDGSFDVVLTY